MSGAAPTASVIVVSRHRNPELLRCLTALAQLDHPAFEVVVVADPAAAGALQARGDAIKVAAFDEENISEARNIGLVMAAGEVVAFLDDDAVPEPSWLRRLLAAFDDPEVGMAGGFVRGFNGIGYQFKAQSIDRACRDHVEPVPEDRVSIHAGNGERTLAPLGTNMAFRRAAVLAVGGFDRALKY
ncbi:glycosyltransferase family 2 protein, partial [Thioclava sp. BHET1]